MAQLPIACTLSPDDLRARRNGLLPGLLQRTTEQIALPDGYRFRFDPTDADTMPAIVQVIERERQCCRFLRFTVTLEPDLGPIWLDVTGPAGTQEFLTALLRS